MLFSNQSLNAIFKVGVCSGRLVISLPRQILQIVDKDRNFMLELSLVSSRRHRR